MNTNDKAKIQEFITALYIDNYRKMMSMVGKDLICHSLAEDIVQETFCEALRNIDELSKHENPGGWLMETAKFKMKEIKRRINARSIHEAEEVELELESIKNEYGLVELSIIMDSTLTIHEKTLFHMFYMEGYSVKEMARLENISESNFRVKMLRIRAKIINALEVKKGN